VKPAFGLLEMYCHGLPACMGLFVICASCMLCCPACTCIDMDCQCDAACFTLFIPQAEWREKLRVLQQRLAAVGQEVALASRQTVPAVAALRDDKALSRASPVPVPHKQEDIVLAAVAAATGPTQVTSSTAGYVQVGHSMGHH
jgi:hypothetical protein